MGRTFLITGASTGIGAATARLLAPGNDVIIHFNRSAEAAEQVAAEVKSAGGTAYLVQADVMTEADCRKIVSFAMERCGKLDALVNNAGGLLRREAARELTWQTMLDIFSLNTFSTMFLSSQCIGLLEKGEHPSIVNVTSIAVRHGAPSATIYGACKGALDTFTRGLAKELAPTIRVNAVAPGVIDTPFHHHVTPAERMKAFAEAAPLGRNGKAEEIASAIAFLIDNQFTTGETLDVNGGLFMQ